MSSMVLPGAPQNGENQPRSQSRNRFLVSGLVLGVVWFVLTGGRDPSSWIIGLPAVLAAAWCYKGLSRGSPHRPSMLAVARFVPVFFWESFKGGTDVARRVVGPRVDVDPGFFDYRLGLILPSARVFFVDLVSLLPGTLSADIHGDTLRVHALDRGVDPTGNLRRLERLVAAIFRDDRAIRAS